MWRDAWYLTRADAGLLFRSRMVWIWAFIMPLVFFFFLGNATGGFSRRTAAPPAFAVLAPADGGFLADLVVERLGKQGYSTVRVATDAELARYTRRLKIPAGFTVNVLAGKAMKVEFVRSGEGLDNSYDQVRASKAVYTVLADLIVVAGDGAPVTRESLDAVAARPRNLSVEVSAAGRRTFAPSGFEQAVPGTMVMFILMTMFNAGSVWLVIEREQGVLRRLASTPMSRGAVVAGKWGARMALALIQTAFAMTAGAALFRMDWGPNLWMIALILTAYAALCVSLSVLVGAMARTLGQAIATGVLASNIMAALGGCWWPIEITPPWAQSLALLFPTGWTMDALHRLVSFGDPPPAAVPHLIALGAAALLAGWLAARRFRFQ
jgi:ABC-type multidrug transport system permease subunit